jgi:hypothetical protein
MIAKNMKEKDDRAQVTSFSSAPKRNRRSAGVVVAGRRFVLGSIDFASVREMPHYLQGLGVKELGSINQPPLLT